MTTADLGSTQQLELPTSCEAIPLAPEVVLCKGIIPWGDRLIQVAESLQHWTASFQADTSGSRTILNSNRTSYGMPITGAAAPELFMYEVGLSNAFHSCVRYYKTYNKYLHVVRDTRYELLRYREGQEFKCHVDAIAGVTEGNRQLSGVAFINDDYLGGELYFPRQDLKVKAEAGDIVLFPSNFCYPHASLPITKGTKYSVVTWFTAT